MRSVSTHSDREAADDLVGEQAARFGEHGTSVADLDELAHPVVERGAAPRPSRPEPAPRRDGCRSAHARARAAPRRAPRGRRCAATTAPSRSPRRPTGRCRRRSTTAVRSGGSGHRGRRPTSSGCASTTGCVGTARRHRGTSSRSRTRRTPPARACGRPAGSGRRRRRPPASASSPRRTRAASFVPDSMPECIGAHVVDVGRDDGIEGGGPVVLASHPACRRSDRG